MLLNYSVLIQTISFTPAISVVRRQNLEAIQVVIGRLLWTMAIIRTPFF